MRRARLRTAVNLAAAGQRRTLNTSSVPGPGEPTDILATEASQAEEQDSSLQQQRRRASEKENEEEKASQPEAAAAAAASATEAEAALPSPPTSGTVAPTAAKPAAPSTSGLIRLKQRFKPNLVQNTETASVVRNRLRKMSGSEGVRHRARTNSTASETSDMGSPPPPPPLPQQHQATPPPPPPTISVQPPTVMSPPRVLQEQQSQQYPSLSVRSSEDDTCYNNNSGSRPAARQFRRLTSTDTAAGDKGVEPTVFDKRKADHKKKFTQGPPERTKITMFDLIYYNPNGGSRMSTESAEPSPSSSARTSRANSVDSRRASVSGAPATAAAAAAATDEAGGEGDDPEDNEEDAMPVPQVKVGPDGSIIIDEATTVIDTTQAKKAQKDLLNSTLVFESSNKATNYGSWGKKRKNVDWSDRETIRFFKALSVFGTDFSMMENVFKRRSRQDLKMKFKKEERTNRPLVDKCLSQGLKFDASFFDEESEQEENEEELIRLEKEDKAKKKEDKKKAKAEERKAAAASKKPKKRVRKVKSNRGYFDNSSEEDEESVDDPITPRNSIGSDTSAPPGKRARRSTRSASSGGERTESSSLLKAILEKNAAVQAAPPEVSTEAATSPVQPLSIPAGAAAKFPPGLLAANPSLANAATGSLVVVGGEGGEGGYEANQQLLHVFRVAEDGPPSTSDSTLPPGDHKVEQAKIS